ncbi:hypothetical protein Vi05172_g5598 [Venturia inaequalis]|nr:hypothetical protein Vi05172_g5598 [Venturia inaequalis]
MIAFAALRSACILWTLFFFDISTSACVQGVSGKSIIQTCL